MGGHLPHVGSFIYVKSDIELDIVSGSAAKKVHIDPDLTLQVVSNDLDGPRLKIINPMYMGKPVSQFSDRLILGLTYNVLVQLKKQGRVHTG